MGGLSGGISGGIEAGKLGADIWSGARPDQYGLASELTVAGSSAPAPYSDDYLNKLKKANFDDVEGVGSITTKNMPKGYTAEHGYFCNPNGKE